MSETSLDALVAAIAARGADRRAITAIAGPPGAGKSTLADRLAARLNEREGGSASVLPMDGFHYDDEVLNARGWRPRKGAPHTFDVGGFAALLTRIKANDEAEIAVPVFDRSLEIARAGARIIHQKVRHVLVEGNYVLLDEPPWSALAFDLTVFLPVPMAELERRLTERWAALSPADRHAKLHDNDLPNAQLVLSSSRPADFVLHGW